MNSIPILDLRRQYSSIGEEVSAVVLSVLSSGQYVGGPPVTAFEQEMARYLTTAECISCNSGTDALYLALRALKIGPGDEVITSPFSFIATTEAISMVGATPVFVDICATTFNLDPAQAAAAITPRTRAILPVHLFGQAAAMKPLMAIAKKYDLAVVEDCAQAIGAEWEGQKVGAIGQIGCFSFYPTKNLGGCGDGGAVVTNDPAIAAQIRQLRDHGRRAAYEHELTGINSRLDTLQAAILQVKLRHLDIWNQQRRQIAQQYHSALQQIPEITLPQSISHSVWNQYTIRLAPDVAQESQTKSEYRDRIRQSLQHQGISTMVYYPLPLHLQPVYQQLGYASGQFPIAEQAAQEVLSLPIFPELTLEEQAQVIQALKTAIAKISI